MTVDALDSAFMARALHLARRGIFTTDPNPNVGCVVVSGDTIVGEGWHESAGGPHAEVAALDAAGEAARGATAYVTLEPCCHHGRTPPCTDALIEAGIARVVFASRDPNPEVAGEGETQLISAGIDVNVGVLDVEARLINRGYMKRMQSGRPHVVSKIAASLDGRTALASGVSQWITGDAARADVQRLRAAASAILTGVGTVAADDPSLNVRAAELGDVRQPARVIVDSELRMPENARTLTLPGDIVVFACMDSAANRAALEAHGVRVEIVAAATGGGVDLDAVLERLAESGVNDVLVEAGARLNGTLLRLGLIDELIVYVAGSVLGDEARGMFDIGELTDMSERAEFVLAEVRHVGENLRLTWTQRT